MAAYGRTVIITAAGGFGLGLSLIVAIGSQNAFVLRQGIRREHVLPVVVVCAVSDAVLISIGVAGAGWMFDRAPWLIETMRYAGAAFLVIYGLMAARRAIHPRALVPDAAGTSVSLSSALVPAVLLTWLNPHVYLDTVVLLGSVANAHGEARWVFAAGAAAGSILWFSALGFGARFLGPVFRRPAAWRVLDALVSAVMIALAVGLLVRR